MKTNSKLLVPRYKFKALFLISFICLVVWICAASHKDRGESLAAKYDDALQGLAFGDPIPNLPDLLQQDFEKGFQLFTKQWTQRDGIGPLFNAQSCAACHAEPMPGGSGTATRTFVLHSTDNPTLTDEGVFQRFKLGADGLTILRDIPSNTSLRKSPAMFGLGLLEAVPHQELLKHEDPNDTDRDGISGRLVKVGNRYGRFGWKGNIPTIDDFVARAFIIEMGLTSNQHPPEQRTNWQLKGKRRTVEISTEQIRLMSQFLRLLAIPPRRGSGPIVERGQEIFQSIGCSKCHVPTLTTGNSSIEALNHRTFHPYTDLLVHDMGSDLNDRLGGSLVLGQEFRTPPLWGLVSTGPPYLHDGRAKTLFEAIVAHGGEGSTSKEFFRRLNDNDQEKLMIFLKSL